MKRGKEAKEAASGFTLIELLTVLAVAAVLTSLAAAAFGSLRVTSAANAEARRIYAVLRAARWKAVRTGARTRIATAPDGKGGITCVPQRRSGSSWVPDGDIMRTAPGLTVEVTGPAAKTFTPRGTCSFGSIVIRGGAGVPYRLSLNPATGRVRLRKGGKDAHDAG